MGNNNIMKTSTKYYLALFVFMIMFGCVINSNAQTSSDTVKTSMKNTVLSNHDFKLQLDVFFGFGTTNILIGKTTNNDDINISGGGGVGGTLSLIYAVTEQIEVALSAGTQESSLSKKLDNGEGHFRRTMLLATVKDKIGLTSDAILKIGAGVGYYIPGDLDIDASKVSGGAHNVFSYKPKVGFHGVAEVEVQMSESFSLGMGIKYYSVKYDIDTFKSDGRSYPTSWITGSDRDKVLKLDGSGFDISIFGALGI